MPALQAFSRHSKAPALPKEIVNRLNAEVRKAVGSADLRERWVSAGMESMDLAPPQIEKAIRDESEQMAKLIRDTGMRLD